MSSFKKYIQVPLPKRGAPFPLSLIGWSFLEPEVGDARTDERKSPIRAKLGDFMVAQLGARKDSTLIKPYVQFVPFLVRFLLPLYMPWYFPSLLCPTSYLFRDQKIN